MADSREFYYMTATGQQDQIVSDIKCKETSLCKSPPKPRLRAATSLTIFMLFLVGQFLATVAVIIFEGVKYVLGGGNIEDQAAFTELLSAVTPQLAFTCIIGGGLGLVAGAFIVKKSLRDNSAFGAAWSKGKPKTILVSIFLGACAASAYFLLPLLVAAPPHGEKVGPLTRMAGQPGLGQFTWIIIALFMTPFIEELLFRGVLLGGLNRSFGLWWGVILSNLLFIAAHFSEAIYYWPAFIGIGLLAALATRQRLVSQAIGPAIAVHFGYNLMIVAVVLVATL